ncbi:hypothetical protein ET445_08235 [Agromyces protaetiae]|uniref:Uncharacterized protein n=1 Tax=Agromyces protaetiae TaxID=2509455 RepID=A0A4P6FBW3_9MICO|nr:hypothetical protein [Agromyces protaetiae]QAY73334.1 hypothetical protein ET445_08235 [Agromyces protaetiae]
MDQIQTLILTFVLTTVIGGFLGAWFQRWAWKRQVRLDQAGQSYADLNAIFEELTVLVDSRYFALFKWNQALAEECLSMSSRNESTRMP